MGLTDRAVMLLPGESQTYLSTFSMESLGAQDLRATGTAQGEHCQNLQCKMWELEFRLDLSELGENGKKKIIIIWAVLS